METIGEGDIVLSEENNSYQWSKVEKSNVKETNKKRNCQLFENEMETH